jgi:hypothetical protein
MKRIKLLLVSLFLLINLDLLGQTTIRMNKEGGVFTVPCNVNGLSLKFIFDTGATNVTISLAEAWYMLKNGYLDREDIVGKEYFTDATGDLSAGTKIILRKLCFAGLTLYNVEATIVHELDAPLLLGQSAMIKFGKFQIDPNNGVLVIMNGTNESYNYRSYNNNSDYSSSNVSSEYMKDSETFVVITERANFHSQPNYESVRKAYLVKGEKGNSIEIKSGFAYVIFENSKGQITRGWINLNDISFLNNTSQLRLNYESTFKVEVNKTYFYAEPNNLKRKKAYLVYGERFSSTTTKNGFLYTVFTNSSGTKTTGWIKAIDVTKE